MAFEKILMKLMFYPQSNLYVQEKKEKTNSTITRKLFPLLAVTRHCILTHARTGNDCMKSANVSDKMHR